MAAPEERWFIISYDFSKQVYTEKPKYISNMGREKMILFLLGIGCVKMYSFTDSSIHFKLPIKDAETDLQNLYDSIRKEFPNLFFSVNLIARIIRKDKSVFHLYKAYHERESKKGARDGFKNLFDIDVETILKKLEEEEKKAKK
jgi:hypothetical protein